MTIASLEALRDAIRASTGPDRNDARLTEIAFAKHALGHDVVGETGFMWKRISPDHGEGVNVPAYLDPLAGPGVLFAAARERWAECSISTHSSGADAVCAVNLHNGIIKSGTHPLLAHALALAMVEAAIQERDNA